MKMELDTKSSVDLKKFMERVGGDGVLAVELIDLFLDEMPRMSHALHEAIREMDYAAVWNAAHAIKGCVSNFSAQRAIDAAQEIERMGRHGDLAGADAAFVRLSVELQNLSKELKKIAEGLI